MRYASFAADLPAHGTLVFRSAEENEETLRRYGVRQEIRQLGRGTFRCDMAVRETTAGDLYCDRFDLSPTVPICRRLRGFEGRCAMIPRLRPAVSLPRTRAKR